MLRADLTLKVRTMGATGPSSETTEYYKGNLVRSDFGTSYQVIDFSTGRGFTVDPAKREYYPFDRSKQAMMQVVDPSHKIFIEATCSATGEQREWFGYAARRYVTTKRSHNEFNGKSSEVSETQADTWVLDFPAPPHVQGIASPNGIVFLSQVLAGGIMKVPDIKATHIGPRPHGLIVWLKTDQYESEIVALSVAQLDQSLFDVPKGFGEVIPRAFAAPPDSWSDQIELEWRRLLVWLNGLFGS